MRKIYFLLSFFVISFTAVKAQVTGYSFVPSSGTYTAITGGTVIVSSPTSMDSYVSGAITLPTGFTFNGTSYTTAYVSSNGFLTLGSTVPSTTEYTPLSSSSTGNGSAKVIAAFSADLDKAASGSPEIRWQQVGNEVVFQWQDMCRYNRVEKFSFQIRLNTSNGNVVIVYTGCSSATTSTSYQPQVGLRGSTAAGDYQANKVASGSETWAAPLAATTSTDVCRFTTSSPAQFPVDGQTYTWAPPAACSAAPVAGTASTTTTTTVCAGASATITLTGTSAASGLTFQWQSAVAGSGVWSNIASATSSSLSATLPNASTDYRCVVTCAAVSQSANSNTVTINVNQVTYASLPVSEGFENTWIDGCGAASSRSIPSASWRNNPLTGANSWRRDDDGVAGGGWGSLNGAYTPAGANSTSHSARIHTYATTGIGNLDLYMDCSVGNSAKQLSYYYTNAGGTDSLRVFLSTDGGVNFNAIGTKNVVSATWSNIIVPFTSASATTVLRFTAYGDNGSSDIGLDEVNVITLAGCTGTPPTLAISGPASACSGYNNTLTATGFDLNIGGIAYRWQSSTNNVTWTNTSGTNPASFVANQAVTTYYRLVDTCFASGQSAISNVIQINITPATYASLPFTEGFEGTWINGCGTADIPSNSWRNRPVTSDSSWRREDDAPSGGNTAVWTNNTSYLYSPAASAGSHSARFHSGYVNNRGRGIMDLYLDCSVGNSTKQLSFDYINIDGSDSLTVLVSTDGGTSFSRLDTAYIRTVWSNKTILFTSNSATTVVRFMATADYGSTDIGIDNIAVVTIAACSGTPAAATVTGPSTAVCAGTTVNLTATGYPTGMTGITFRWQSSPDNATWTNTTGTTAAAFTTTIGNSNTWFRLVDTCTNGNAFAVSNAVQVTVNSATYATVPFTESFENTWIDGCGAAGSKSIPTNSWRNTPVTGNNSWRRNDETTTNSGWSSTSGAYTPAASAGTYSARIHTYSTSASGNFDLFLDCSTGAITKQIAYDYINTSGSDSLKVFLSTDGGNSFTFIGNKNTTVTTWSTITVPFSSSSATTVIRFTAYGDAGSTDIGLDNIAVTAVACGTPTVVTASAITTTGATIGWTAPGAAPNSYELYYSTTSTAPTSGTVPQVTNITGTSTNLGTLASSSTYFVWVRSNCGGAGTSTWSVAATFNTACATGNVPYTQNFDAVTAPTLPPCISVLDVNADGKTWATSSNSSYLIGGTNSMTYTWNSASAADDWFFTAPLTLTGGTQYTLKFAAASYASTYFEKLEVKYGPSATVAGMTSSALYTNTAMQGPAKVQVPFTPASTGTYYFGFHAFSIANQFFLSVDSILVDLSSNLPIVLNSFKGERQGANNILSWTTASEINNTGFELQRSADGINFSTLTFVGSKASNGNSNAALAYTFTDTKALVAGSYYRLKQIDKDGKSTLSQVVFIKGVKVNKLELVSVYPNPAIDKLNVALASPKADNVIFVVSDLSGKVLIKQTAAVINGDNNISVNVGALAKGTYTIKAICADGCETAISKFVKQ